MTPDSKECTFVIIKINVTICQSHITLSLQRAQSNTMCTYITQNGQMLALKLPLPHKLIQLVMNVCLSTYAVIYRHHLSNLLVPTTGILCDPPVLTASVFVSPPPSVGGRYRVGDAVVYRCDPPTYRIVGASGAVCKSDSIWSAAPPICIATL